MGGSPCPFLSFVAAGHGELQLQKKAALGPFVELKSSAMDSRVSLRNSHNDFN